MMSVPTQGEVLARLTERIRLIQEDAATMAHLTRSMSSTRKDQALADGWIAMSEMFKRVNYQIIQLGKGKLQ